MFSVVSLRLLLLRWRRLALRGCAMAGLSLLVMHSPGAASAPTESRRTYQLAGGDAGRALREFSEQSGWQVIAPTALTRGVKTQPVDGDLTAREALECLLQGTGLIGVQDDGARTFAIKRDAAPRPVQDSAAAARRAPLNPARLRALARLFARRPDIPVTDARPIVLSPFQVLSEADKAYQATSTLAGTGLRSNLKDLPGAISVATKTFMYDVNATDVTSLFVYTLGLEVGGYGGNFSAVTNPEADGEFNDAVGQASPGTRVRGLIAADWTRDFFLTDIPMDTYNLERIEISRGASPILFGLGSPAGIVNQSVIRAGLGKTATSVAASVGSYGSHRATLDHNRVLSPGKVALRVATVHDTTKYTIAFAESRKKAATLTGTYHPARSTIVRATSEFGRSDSNRPQIRPPYDRFSWWWAAGQPVWNPVSGTGRFLGTPQAPFSASTEGAGAIFGPEGDRIGIEYLTANWDGLTPNVPGIFYQDPATSVVGGIDIGGGHTVDGIKGFADNAYLSADGTRLVSGGMLGLNSWPSVMRSAYLADDPLRMLYRKEPMVFDPAVFDFHHQMLDGPTKYEWAWWEAHNVTLEQTFFEERAGLALAFDRQRLDNGYTSPIRQTINLDINEVLPDGTPNPNFLRPVTLSGGFKRVCSQDREAFRATAYYAADLRRMPGPGWLSAVLGRHLFNATFTRQESFYQKFGGTLWNSDLDWRIYEGLPLPGTASSTARIVSTVHYLGDSVRDARGPAGVRLQGLSAVQDPSGRATMTLLTHQRPPNSSPDNLQAWSPATFNLVSNGRYDVRNTIRNANSYSKRAELQVRSFSTALQSHWFEGGIVTTAGWRRDRVRSLDAGIPGLTEAGTADIRWEVWHPELVRAVEEDSGSWGVVGNLPRRIERHLPLGLEVSTFYNRATNFRITPQRFTIAGRVLPSETGETTDYGIRLSALEGKLDFRFGRYTTLAANASLPSLSSAIGQISDLVSQQIGRNYAGDNAGNPEGIAQFERWLESHHGRAYRSAFGSVLEPNENPAKPAEHYGRYASATGDRGQITAVSSLEATGLEMELVFNPTPNWRLYASAASADAVRTQVAPDLHAFIFDPDGGLFSLVQNPDGTPTAAGLLLGPGLTDLYGFVHNSLVNTGVMATFAQEGSRNDELKKWSFRAVTNYRFATGRLKGFEVGGAVRWSDRPLLGYGGKVENGGVGPLATFDVNRPIYGPRETIVDLSLGYRRDLASGVRWQIQLFVKNVGVGNELRPLAAWPDGQIIQWTIKEPQRWTLTSTFTF